jgi:hypothetical protein
MECKAAETDGDYFFVVLEVVQTAGFSRFLPSPRNAGRGEAA